MNIEFIKLSDGTTATTDENGKISKIKTETSREELLIENKIETIDKSINETKKKVNDYKASVWISKHMLISQPILAVIMPFLGYAFGNLNSLINALGPSILIFGAATTLWGIAYPITKKKLKGYEGKLEKAEELKLEFEKEMTKEKKLISQKEKPPINEPISLIKQNEIEIPLIDEQLEIAYSNSIHPKTKNKVLGHKPNKR